MLEIPYFSKRSQPRMCWWPTVGSACLATMSPFVTVLRFPLRTTSPPTPCATYSEGPLRCLSSQNGNRGQRTQSQTMVGGLSPMEVAHLSARKQAGLVTQTGGFPHNNMELTSAPDRALSLSHSLTLSAKLFFLNPALETSTDWGEISKLGTGVLITNSLQETITYFPCQSLSLSLHSIKGLGLNDHKGPLVGWIYRNWPLEAPGSWQHKAPIVRASEACSLKRLIPRLDDSDKED